MEDMDKRDSRYSEKIKQQDSTNYANAKIRGHYFMTSDDGKGLIRS